MLTFNNGRYGLIDIGYKRIVENMHYLHHFKQIFMLVFFPQFSMDPTKQSFLWFVKRDSSRLLKVHRHTLSVLLHVWRWITWLELKQKYMLHVWEIRMTSPIFNWIKKKIYKFCENIFTDIDINGMMHDTNGDKKSSLPPLICILNLKSDVISI